MAPKKMLIDFEKMFSISLTALRIIGAHPSIPRNKSWLLRFFVTHGIFTAMFCLFIYNIRLCLILKNYSEACRNGTFAAIYCVITFKYFILVVKQSTITRIINMMKADYADIPEDKEAIVFAYAEQGRKVILQWMILVASTWCLFLTKHLYLELYTYVTDDWKLLEMYPLTYPSPAVEENKEHPAVFVLIYLVELYYILYAGFMYLGFVPLGPVFMLHACGQLEIAKMQALALYVNNSTREVEVKLAEIVKRLQYIYGFVECVNTGFKLLYEVTLKATSLMLPIIVYEVLGSLKREEFNIEFVTITIGAVLISSGPCYFSDKLMEKGEEVRLAIYSCGWETRYDHGVRRTLSMILLRTLRPIGVRTVFRTVCLDTLADIYHQAYALFNVMTAAWR